jgi:hypothetical protein
MALPDSLPAEVDLSDTGEDSAQRLAGGGRIHAHDRMRATSMRAYFEALKQEVRWPSTSELEDQGDEDA